MCSKTRLAADFYMKILKSGAASQREQNEMRFFRRLAVFSPGSVVPTIAAGRRLASRRKPSPRDSDGFSNTPVEL